MSDTQGFLEPGSAFLSTTRALKQHLASYSLIRRESPLISTVSSLPTISLFCWFVQISVCPSAFHLPCRPRIGLSSMPSLETDPTWDLLFLAH